MKPYLSVVIPVYNESENIPVLVTRLLKSLSALNKSYEVIFTNDGSSDDSLNLLKKVADDNLNIKIIDFKGNYGQHMAVIAGFELAEGDVILTLDADLQNPPEEIHKLLSKIEEGFDYVGSYRDKRQDTFFRTYVSRFINWIRERMTDIRMKDQGCMLRAYRREIVQKIVSAKGHSTFIPALAYKLSKNPAEVEVVHAARAAGVSKYNLYMLARLNFDLITGFSIVPLQLFTMFGLLISLLNGVLVAYLVVRRLFMGPEAEGVFTLFAATFFLLSVIIFGIGLIGEYLGRLALNFNSCARYEIREIYSHKNNSLDNK